MSNMLDFSVTYRIPFPSSDTSWLSHLRPLLSLESPPPCLSEFQLILSGQGQSSLNQWSLLWCPTLVKSNLPPLWASKSILNQTLWLEMLTNLSFLQASGPQPWLYIRTTRKVIPSTAIETAFTRLWRSPGIWFQRIDDAEPGKCWGPCHVPSGIPGTQMLRNSLLGWMNESFGPQTPGTLTEFRQYLTVHNSVLHPTYLPKITTTIYWVWTTRQALCQAWSSHV